MLRSFSFNSEDPDEMPQHAVFNQGLHYLLALCKKRASHLTLDIYNGPPKLGLGNTMPDLSDLVPFHSGQVENFYLLVIG